MEEKELIEAIQSLLNKVVDKKQYKLAIILKTARDKIKKEFSEDFLDDIIKQLNK